MMCQIIEKKKKKKKKNISKCPLVNFLPSMQSFNEE